APTSKRHQRRAPGTRAQAEWEGTDEQMNMTAVLAALVAAADLGANGAPMHDVARTLAEAGLAVFPCKSTDKSRLLRTDSRTAPTTSSRARRGRPSRRQPSPRLSRAPQDSPR